MLDFALSLDQVDLLAAMISPRVAEAPRRALKVASVVGRVFRVPTLSGVYPELGGVIEIADHLAMLTTADLVHPEIEAEQSYVFKHAITQEVAYESMPFAFRSALHERAGAFIERTEAGAIDRHLDLLAHHYSHSENVAKKREYLGRAGDAAQAVYANAVAIDYFERLAPLVDGKDRVELLLKLGKVVELVGDWKRAEEVDTQALTLAVSLDDVKWRASCDTALAEVARKQGRFDEALERLARAARGFETMGDESGVGLVKHLAGTVAAQRGDYPKAVENYEASLVIRERIGDKVSMGSLLSNLGIIAEYRGDYETSRSLHDRALQLRTDIGDRRGIGNSTTNLGMIAVLQKQFAEARDWFRKSMLLNREVGDAWMVALCDHNLANATRGLGEHDAARSHYAASLGCIEAMRMHGRSRSCSRTWACWWRPPATSRRRTSSSARPTRCGTRTTCHARLRASKRSNTSSSISPPPSHSNNATRAAPRAVRWGCTPRSTTRSDCADRRLQRRARLAAIRFP